MWGENGLNVAKCAKEDIDEDSVVTFGTVILFFEKPRDRIFEVGFDNLIAFGIIFS